MIEARLKYIVKSQKGKVPKTFSDDNSFLPYLSMEYLRGKNEEISYVVDDGNCFLVDENDVLVLWDGANAGEIMLSKRGFLSSTMAVLTPDERYFQKRFFFYFLKSKESEFKKAANGTTIPHLDQEIVFETRYHIPEISEQESITNYLDTQSEKINRFIIKKERFIELLKEQKNITVFSLIHLEGIKNNYPQRRIKSFSKILRGKFSHRPRNDERLYDGQYPFIQTGEVSQANKYIIKYRQTLNELGYSVSKEFPKGTLCLTIAANVGDVAILDFSACFPDSIVGIVPNTEVDLDFLYYALKSLKTKLISEATLTTQYNLNVERIGPIRIPLPDIENQKEIVLEIEREALIIDTAIAKAEREIELIKEYKEAMIAEMVMGKTKFN